MSRPLPNIVHLDADAFFVSVELALQPQYRGKKVAVGGRERGIIASASYEARACGVYTPMPTARALKICPDLILLPHKGSYGDVSRRMFDLCENLTPIVQRNSIDEGYLDVTMCGFKTQDEIVAAIRDLQNRIWQQLQIPVSMGIATNRLVAQIASKLRKPRGFVVVPPGEEAAFLARSPSANSPASARKRRKHSTPAACVSSVTLQPLPPAASRPVPGPPANANSPPRSAPAGPTSLPPHAAKTTAPCTPTTRTPKATPNKKHSLPTSEISPPSKAWPRA